MGNIYVNGLMTTILEQKENLNKIRREFCIFWEGTENITVANVKVSDKVLLKMLDIRQQIINLDKTIQYRQLIRALEFKDD